MYRRDLELEKNWHELLDKLESIMGKRPVDVKSILFMIGVQELGQGVKTFSKEEKQDLMHIAVCKVLSFSGFYTLEGLDDDGWPHWKLEKKLPHFDLLEQERFLKMNILEYFQKEVSL